MFHHSIKATSVCPAIETLAISSWGSAKLFVGGLVSCWEPHDCQHVPRLSDYPLTFCFTFVFCRNWGGQSEADVHFKGPAQGVSPYPKNTSITMTGDGELIVTCRGISTYYFRHVSRFSKLHIECKVVISEKNDAARTSASLTLPISYNEFL